MGKNPPASAGELRDRGSIPGSGRAPGGSSSTPTPVLLAGKSHGQSSLVGYSPRGCKVSHVTRVTSHTAPFRASKCYTRYRASALSGLGALALGSPPFHPPAPTSMVCAWCIALIAVCAMALVVKVTNAQPGERRANSSSIHLMIYLTDIY